MIDVEEFIENVLQHKTEYDPVEAHEYYMRTRKLKGRKPAQKKQKILQEDEVPMKSPKGSKLLSFTGDRGGRAIYEDGSTYDSSGWNSGKVSARHRLTVAQRNLNQAKKMARTRKDPKLDKRLVEMQDKLDAIKRKQLKNRAQSKIQKSTGRKNA